MNDETMVFFGDAVKALGDGKVGGYLVRFSTEADPDLDGDFFTKSTDFGTHTAVPVLYQHGMDPAMGRKRLGSGTLRKDDVGMWIEAQMELRNDYERAIYDMAKSGKLGWSSGTAAHLVEREAVGKANRVTAWPLGLDASLTPTPAEPRTRAVPLKSLYATPDPKTDDAEAASKTASDPVKDGDNIDSNQHSESVKGQTITMSDNPVVDVVQTETPDPIKSMGSRIDALTAHVSKILDHLESEPSSKTAGFITNDGGTKDSGVKTFADFLLAVKRRDEKRLTSVYGSTKDMSGETGTAGGYVVPETFATSLLQFSDQESGILSRVTTVPVRTPSGSYPVLDQYITPTAGSGDTALAAGIQVDNVAEGAAFGESQPGFEQLNWRVRKIGGVVDVPAELNDDSFVSIESLLRSLFGLAVRSQKERNVLRGTGSGQFLGILNSAAAVGISPATDNQFALADAMTMISRHKRVMGQPVWIMHPSVIPDLQAYFTVTAGASNVQPQQAPPLGNLLSYPILYSEHLPQANNAGNVILADLSAYLIFDRQQLTIDFSTHAKFENDLVVWRVKTRADGMPWVRNPIVLADPQGSFTQSPFVYHND